MPCHNVGDHDSPQTPFVYYLKKYLGKDTEEASHCLIHGFELRVFHHYHSCHLELERLIYTAIRLQFFFNVSIWKVIPYYLYKQFVYRAEFP